jgi:transcriptional regulator with XRE-family HTH domain
MSTVEAESEVGAMLRGWRERRRLSQQALSDLSAVSTRHLSRVETSLAQPSPEMILHLAEHLEVPLQDRNRLLLAGGYAPRYGDRPLTDASLSVVMGGLRALLDAHAPYPALLLDDHWDLVDANPAVDLLLAGVAPALLEPPVNVVRLCLSPDGLAPRIRNLAEWAAYLHAQLRSRAERTGDPRHRDLADEVATTLPSGPAPVPAGPVLTLRLRTERGELTFFSTSARLTTATDVALDGLHLETFLPADEATRTAFEQRQPTTTQVRR